MSVKDRFLAYQALEISSMMVPEKSNRGLNVIRGTSHHPLRKHVIRETEQ
jgi:hypothetical protein